MIGGGNIGFFQIISSGSVDALEAVIPATEVPSDQAVYTHYFDFGDARVQAATTFLSQLIAGGGNINVYDGSKTVQFARHVNITAGLTDGQVWIRFENLSSTVDNYYYLYANPSQGADYAVTDTYGRNATFNQEFKAVWDFEETPVSTGATSTDLTGNGYGMQMTDSNHSVPPTHPNGRIGKAWKEASGIEMKANFPQISYPTEIGGWSLFEDANGAWAGFLQYSYSFRWYMLDLASSVLRTRNRNISVDIESGSTLNMNQYYHLVHHLKNNTDKRAYLNGNLDITDNDNVTLGTTDTVLLAKIRADGAARSGGAEYSFLYVREQLLDEDRIAIEHNNQKAGGFASFVSTINEVTF